jgi:hypothetical protein
VNIFIRFQVFKLEVIEVLTLLLMTSETMINSELAIHVLSALRNLAQATSQKTSGRQLIIGEARKAALIGLVQTQCLRLMPNARADGFEVRKCDIYAQVEGGGIAVQLLPKIMKIFKKRSPKVLSCCLAYLLALCGGAQESGERVALLFRMGYSRLALATLAIYAPGTASEHLPKPPFVLKVNGDMRDIHLQIYICIYICVCV